MASEDQELERLTNDPLDEDAVRTRRATRIMVSVGLVFVAIGAALLSAVASPFGRAIGAVLLLWGIGTIPAMRRMRRARVLASASSEWR